MGKLFVILAAIAAAGLLLIGGGAWYWWKHHSAEFLESGKAAMTEGQAAGRRLDEGACMVLAIDRHKADWNRTMASAVRNNLWLSGCLDASRAQEKFCDGVPAKDDVVGAGLWAASSCARHGFSDSYCGNLFSSAVKYCGSAQRAEKLRPGTARRS